MMETKHTEKITLHDAFWCPIREVIRKEAIPYQWKALNDQIEGAEPSYCMRNFRIAAGKETGKHGGYVFQDSDVAKWLEGVAFSLIWHPDAELEHIADSAIDEIAAAQQPDGYLDTYYIIGGLEKRWTNLMDHHELYCAGHLIEAGVAYYQATGKRKLLDVVLHYVDHIDSIFGAEEGKLHGYPGHPVIEMALMRLYDITHDDRHLKLARYFITQRGQKPLYFEEERIRNHNECHWLNGPLKYAYYQAHEPLVKQQDAVGHAVRALYLYSGMADVARESNDEELKESCRRLWRSVTERRMYITGSVGSSAYGEAFTFDYDLPNDTVYGETCAAIALIFFAQRMLRMEPKGIYADVMERALFNGVLSGMQLDGRRFFYVNPLEVVPEACKKDEGKIHVKAERQPWFGCACCPPNLVRLLASLENYLVAIQNNTLFVHSYASCDVVATIAGVEWKITVETKYPWEGTVSLHISGSGGTFPLALHLPGWCRSYTLTRNGKLVSLPAHDGYLYMEDASSGDEIVLKLDMSAQWVCANPRVREDIGKIALTRGPVVYCLEEADNGPDLHLVRVASTDAAQAEICFEPELLNGVVTVQTPAFRLDKEAWDEHVLYSASAACSLHPVKLKWIPYYAWANRGIGEMYVWIQRA